MARWEQYDFYPKEGVRFLKPSYNPMSLLIMEIQREMKNKGLCVKKKS